jgi:probable F420-dependent oxidoreductase
VRIGFALPVSGSWAVPENIVSVARRAEELGYASLWTFQRLLVPSPNQLAPVYQSVLDPTVVLAHVAAVTTRVSLGVAVINAPFQSPALLAKQLTTLDLLSGERLVPGLGLGWLPEEFTASGVPYSGRGARMEEYLRTLRTIWDDAEPVSHSGSFYSVPPSLARPRPARRIPLLLGGDVPAALARAGRLADGWVSSSRVPPTELGQRISIVRRAAEEAGRDPDTLAFVCRGVLRAGERPDLDSLAAQGVTEYFADLNFDPAVGAEEADPEASMARCDEVLQALAP